MSECPGLHQFELFIRQCVIKITGLIYLRSGLGIEADMPQALERKARPRRRRGKPQKRERLQFFHPSGLIRFRMQNRMSYQRKPSPDRIEMKFLHHYKAFFVNLGEKFLPIQKNGRFGEGKGLRIDIFTNQKISKAIHTGCFHNLLKDGTR